MPAADEVRTVFITGFPEDVRERELNNMLRFLPGYEVRLGRAWQHGTACLPPLFDLSSGSRVLLRVPQGCHRGHYNL